MTLVRLPCDRDVSASGDQVRFRCPGFLFFTSPSSEFFFWYTSQLRAVVFSDKLSREATANKELSRHPVGCLQLSLNAKRSLASGHFLCPWEW